MPKSNSEDYMKRIMSDENYSPMDEQDAVEIDYMIRLYTSAMQCVNANHRNDASELGTKDERR